MCSTVVIPFRPKLISSLCRCQQFWKRESGMSSSVTKVSVICDLKWAQCKLCVILECSVDSILMMAL